MGGRGGSSGTAGSGAGAVATDSPFAITASSAERRKVSQDISNVTKRDTNGDAYFEANGKAVSILDGGRDDFNLYKHGSYQVYEVTVTDKDFKTEKRIAYTLDEAKRMAKAGLGLSGGK